MDRVLGLPAADCGAIPAIHKVPQTPPGVIPERRVGITTEKIPKKW